MKPTVSLPDPERAVIDVLASGRPAGSVGSDYPSTTLAASDFRVQVDLEGGDVRAYPVTERARVRVTIHAAPGRRTFAKQLAAAMLADLYSFPGSADMAGIVPLSGRSGISVDPTTRNVMCWVLVRVDLKASLAS